MNERNRTEDSTQRQSQQRAEAIRTLRSWEQEAENGRKLTGSDRLKAALHLSRAWRQANDKGLRKEVFQDDVFARLKRRRENKTRTYSDTFKLANWILPRKVDAITPNLVSEYAEKREPLKSLEPYLVGVAVAAMHCGADPNNWKLDLMRDLSIWTRPVSAPEVAEADDRPAETLSLLLNAVCRSIAHKNKLAGIFAAIRSMGCRWEMFDERLVESAEFCMQSIESPVSPVCEVGVYFEEMFPFPSISLLSVPYLVGTADFRLAPEASLRAHDDANQSQGDYVATGSAMKNDGPFRHYNIPDDAPSQLEVPGGVVFFRELRVTLLLMGTATSALRLNHVPRSRSLSRKARRWQGRILCTPAMSPISSAAFSTHVILKVAASGQRSRMPKARLGAFVTPITLSGIRQSGLSALQNPQAGSSILIRWGRLVRLSRSHGIFPTRLPRQIILSTGSRSLGRWAMLRRTAHGRATTLIGASPTHDMTATYHRSMP